MKRDPIAGQTCFRALVMTLVGVLGFGCPENPPPTGTPILVVAPEAIDFGDVSFTETPFSSRTVTLTNDGDGDLELGDITLAGESYALPGRDRSGNVLSPGTSVELPIQLEATRDGEHLAQLRVFSNAGDAVDVPVVADVHAPRIDVSPWSYDFGNPVVGCAPSVTITIENVGRETLLVESVELDGNDEWALETVVVDVSVEPGASTGVVARYQPDDPEPDQSELNIRSNAPDLPEAIVDFEGRSHFETEATESFQGGATRYPLTFGAVWETIRISINGDRVFTGWSYDSSGPAIVFEAAAAPSEQDTVRVVYIALGSC